MAHVPYFEHRNDLKLLLAAQQRYYNFQ